MLKYLAKIEGPSNQALDDAKKLVCLNSGLPKLFILRQVTHPTERSHLKGFGLTESKGDNEMFDCGESNNQIIIYYYLS